MCDSGLVEVTSSSRFRLACLLLVSILLLTLPEPSSADPPIRASAGAGKASTKPAMRRVVILGLRRRGKPARFAGQVSNPASSRYRRFLSQAQFRSRFSATAADRRRVMRFLRSRRGVFKVRMNPSGTVVMTVMSQRAAKSFFCAGNGPLPVKGLCRPNRLRQAVWQVSAGEVFQPQGKKSGREPAAAGGTPEGCQAALKGKTITPNQLATAYGVDPLHARRLDGSGIRVATLSSQSVETTGFATWARCFGLRTPNVKQVAMPGVGATAPEETVLDVEALATLAPGLDRISPIFVPLDQSFSNSFLLFMFGALDPSRQGGKLPHLLSISDGVCEDRFSKAELNLGNRLLTEAAAIGITTLAASGDLGFQGCFTSARGALFPGSSRFTTSVGGTDLKFTAGNSIASEVVWSTFATQSSQGVGTGGGPSTTWARPGFQHGPGIGPALQSGKATRLSPDIAAMASFVPGLSVFDKEGGGWGIGGGTSAATPLSAAMVALVLQQEFEAGRPALGSLPPLLYRLAGGPGYDTVFNDITAGTSSTNPKSAAGRKPSGGAAQPGYDMATGLGSLKAAAFADAVAGQLFD